MKLLKILESLGNKSFTVSEEKSQSRRESIFSIATEGKTLIKTVLPAGIIAAAAIPGSAAARSAGTSSDSIVDVLNFALTLEHLERSFYDQAVNSSSVSVIPASDMPVFKQILKHEGQHVAFLQGVITSLGGTPVLSPNFDFTAGGMFHPGTLYSDFLALSQAFEDTGVRAYKGQAGNVMSNDTVLQAALQIHAVEARHASEVRRIRGQRGWITGDTGAANGNVSQVDAVYAGENNLSQGSVSDVSSITTAGAQAMREGFDEPLTKDQVLAIVTPFIHP